MPRGRKASRERVGNGTRAASGRVDEGNQYGGEDSDAMAGRKERGKAWQGGQPMERAEGARDGENLRAGEKRGGNVAGAAPRAEKVASGLRAKAEARTATPRGTAPGMAAQGKEEFVATQPVGQVDAKQTGARTPMEVPPFAPPQLPRHVLASRVDALQK